MRIPALIGLLLAFLTSLAAAIEQERTVEIFAWPLAASKSESLVKIAYNTTGGVIRSSTPPKFPLNDDVVRVGFYRGSTWSGIVTAASNLAPAKEKRLQLLLDGQGELYHVGLKAVETAATKNGKGKDAGLTVEVVRMKEGPRPHLNKPVVVRQDGSQEGVEPEKTFFQKYWWAIAGVLLVQVFMAGGKSE